MDLAVARDAKNAARACRPANERRASRARCLFALPCRAVSSVSRPCFGPATGDRWDFFFIHTRTNRPARRLGLFVGSLPRRASERASDRFEFGSNSNASGRGDPVVLYVVDLLRNASFPERLSAGVITVQQARCYTAATLRAPLSTRNVFD